MAELLPQLVTGLAGASSLFLLAAGLTVIFGVTRIVNFAHGSLMMLGAYLGWTILQWLPRTPLFFALGVLLAAAATAAIAAAIEVAVLRRVYRAPELFQLLATFGVVLILQDVTLWLWGPTELALSRPRWMRAAVEIAGSRVPVYDLVLIAVGPLVLILLWLLLHRTRWGILLRAATEDREMAGALGINQRWLFTAVLALGGALAGLGGALSLPEASANLAIDLRAVTDAFVVVVVGGLGSLAGAFLASLLLGLLQAFGIVLFPQATLVLAFAAMAAVLAVRPRGLLGRPEPAPPPAAAGTAPPVLRPSQPTGRFLWAALIGLAAVLPFLLDPYALTVLTDALVAVLFAASLHLLMGPGGMPSFGHAAWFGLGAYAAALLPHLLLPDASPPAFLALALLAAPLLAGAVALLFAALVARLSGVYLAMLTLAFAQIVWAVSFQWVALTGGDNGLLGVWPPDALRDPARWYAVVLVLTAAGVILLRHMIFTPAGYALRAARDSEPRARALGLPVMALRAAAITVAGAAAGLAGALFSFGKGAVFPTYVSIPHSVDALLAVLLGGLQTISGPVVGALLYTGLADRLVRATDLWRVWLGLAILVLVTLFPEGLAGAALRLQARLREPFRDRGRT
ncbi:ABC transporter permease [Roseomonas elaeocarpi]|uniref:ABC transporter permease n=1 Tax=Roseomonas elaeocarpi TaxID=907779 RepID=A0ABV6JVW9_9PROT